MKLLNVMRVGMSGVMCAGLLGACADGRGTNGFKSYQYSKTEMARNKAMYDAKNKPAANPKGTNTPPSDDSSLTGDVGLGASQPATPPDAGRGDERQIFTATPPDKADPKAMAEPGGPANQSGVTPLTAKVKDLNVTIQTELSLGDNAVAKSLVKGITVVPTLNGDSAALAIQANLVIAGKEVVMDASGVPVKFLEEGEDVSNFLFSLFDPCNNEPVEVKNHLQASAKCADASCKFFQVALSFETQNPNRRAYAIVVVSNVNGRWVYVASNLGQNPKTFEQSQKACAAPVPAVPAEPAGRPPEPGEVGLGSTNPAGEIGVGTSKPAGDLSIGTSKPAGDLSIGTSAPVKKDTYAECEKKDAEGFSVCDGEGEKNAMRAHRRAVAKGLLDSAAGYIGKAVEYGKSFFTSAPAAPVEKAGGVVPAERTRDRFVTPEERAADPGNDDDTQAVGANGR